MVTFVGAEYIIANSLIALKKTKNRTNISLSELNQLGIYIQQMSIENDVDAVFLVSQDQVSCGKGYLYKEDKADYGFGEQVCRISSLGNHGFSGKNN